MKMKKTQAKLDFINEMQKIFEGVGSRASGSSPQCLSSYSLKIPKLFIRSNPIIIEPMEDKYETKQNMFGPNGSDFISLFIWSPRAV